MINENETAWIHLKLEPTIDDTEDFIIHAETNGIPDGEKGLLRVLKSLVATLETRTLTL